MYRPIVRRFAFFHTLFLSLIDHIVCTVTCRQFPNLTFAPRKTCHIGSNLTFHSYHATAIDIIHGLSKKSKNFFDFFFYVKMSTLNSTFFHVFIVLPFCTIRSLFYCIFSLLGSAIVRLPLLPTSHAPYFRSYASCFTSSLNSSPAE